MSTNVFLERFSGAPVAALTDVLALFAPYGEITHIDDRFEVLFADGNVARLAWIDSADGMAVDTIGFEAAELDDPLRHLVYTALQRFGFVALDDEGRQAYVRVGLAQAVPAALRDDLKGGVIEVGHPNELWPDLH
ncbi:hypothetical protein CEG14_17390 [Bordetella genomosp. 1]|uniref:Uncharacterized protein n=1 Tax=Bordetella genomosp. 1 TaxID=1395607 RepID=A0A261S6S4_9BORD|nr:hypothetical protein [Bordetella genomosp. 1]MDQ8033888.1 hypothetical protein [Bordetella sp.]OZI32682.1 hypothetical protein CEG14_17390 [Bordetella genomosp. 1]OZI65963.1 hypothetical protein CAL27_13335 [Bordetella genomosp. 1]